MFLIVQNHLEQPCLVWLQKLDQRRGGNPSADGPQEMRLVHAACVEQARQSRAVLAMSPGQGRLLPGGEKHRPVERPYPHGLIDQGRLVRGAGPMPGTQCPFPDGEGRPLPSLPLSQRERGVESKPPPGTGRLRRAKDTAPAIVARARRPHPGGAGLVRNARDNHLFIAASDGKCEFSTASRTLARIHRHPIRL